MFEISIDGQGLIRLAGRLDASQAERARDVLSEVDGPATLDCSGLEYISSAGLAVILEMFKRLHGSSQMLTLRNLTPRVRLVFQYAGLDRILRIE